MIFIQRASQFSLRGFFIAISLMIILSCATVFPADAARESPVSFETVETVEPEWQEFADGIGYFNGKTSSPRLEFWALRIDLRTPGMRIVVRSGAVDEGRTLSTRVSSFVRDNNLLAGINAVPFDIVSSREGLPIQNVGIVISDGELFAPANPHYDALVFYADGTAVIVRQSAIRSIENIENAVGGFHQLLINGELAQRTLTREERHPRSAAGISTDGRCLYLLVIDGRRSGSIGATERETAAILRSLGAWDGINFDGGGSSALALRFPDDVVRIVNTPIHGGILGQERAVAGCLGVAFSLSTER
jgi:hypothetical protein